MLKKMPYENWGKTVFQVWTFYIQFLEPLSRGKVRSREVFFCHFSFSPLPLLPPPQLSIDEDSESSIAQGY